MWDGSIAAGEPAIAAPSGGVWCFSRAADALAVQQRYLDAKRDVKRDAQRDFVETFAATQHLPVLADGGWVQRESVSRPARSGVSTGDW